MRIICIIIMCLFFSSCHEHVRSVAKGRTESLSQNSAEIEQEQSSPFRVEIYYPERYMGEYFDDEYVARSGEQLLSGSKALKNQKATYDFYNLLGPLDIDDSLIISRIHFLLSHLGINNEGYNDRFRSVAEMAMVLEYKDKKEIIGLGWGPEAALDSDNRGFLFPSPELYDIVVSYIANHDSRWYEIQIQRFRDNNPPWQYGFRKVKVQDREYLSDMCLDCANRDSIPIFYMNDMHQLCEIDPYSATRMRSIDNIYEEAYQNGTLQSCYIVNPALVRRINDRLKTLQKIEEGDSRFCQDTYITMIVGDSSGLDTLGIGALPLDCIISTRHGPLYPDPELFLIVVNSVIERDPSWTDKYDAYGKNTIVLDLKERYSVN